MRRGPSWVIGVALAAPRHLIGVQFIGDHFALAWGPHSQCHAKYQRRDQSSVPSGRALFPRSPLAPFGTLWLGNFLIARW